MKTKLETRFHLYAVLRNARFFDGFFVLFLLFEIQLSFTEVGLLLAFEKGVTAIFELPMAVLADRHGRRRCLSIGFALTTLACLIFGYASISRSPFWSLLVGQTVYALGESLRTGAHKAMVMQWLDVRDERHRRVELIGSMRFMSKSTGGISALIGGLIVWQYGQFSTLFLASAIPSTLCGLMILSYPTSVEGVSARATTRGSADRIVWAHLIQILRQPELWMVLGPSIVFESQLKLATAFVQPTLAAGTQAAGYDTMTGAGALFVGCYLALSGLLAGSASLFSIRLENVFGSAVRAQLFIHAATTCVLMLGACALGFNHALIALLLFIGLASLQNARRPLFLATFAATVDPSVRTTFLSLESQLRSVFYAVSSMTLGVVADHHGLAAVFGIMASLVGLTVLVSVKRA